MSLKLATNVEILVTGLGSRVTHCGLSGSVQNLGPDSHHYVYIYSEDGVAILPIILPGLPCGATLAVATLGIWIMECSFTGTFIMDLVRNCSVSPLKHQFWK